MAADLGDETEADMTDEEVLDWGDRLTRRYLDLERVDREAAARYVLAELEAHPELPGRLLDAVVARADRILREEGFEAFQRYVQWAHDYYAIPGWDTVFGMAMEPYAMDYLLGRVRYWGKIGD